MKKKIVSLLAFFLMAFSMNIFGENVFQIIPQPQKMEMKKGNAWHYYELKHLVMSEGMERPVLPSLLDELDGMQGKGKVLQLTLTDKDVPESEEGYVLNVTKKGAEIKARHAKGIFYGCQTLQQLMEDSRDFDVPVPCLSVEDFPAIDYRAIHLDTKHHLDNMNYYYRMVDKLASYKVNAIIWEVEDKLRYTRHPEIAVENSISKQELQALSRYAIERNVEISPLVQGLGHASFILKHHWELRENPKSDWVFCPSNPETYALQFDLYRDAFEAFPYGRYLHVGGDEISAIGVCDRCKPLHKSPFELQMMWLEKVDEFVRANGRTTIFWDDMPLKYGGVWGFLRDNITEEKAAELWKKNTLDKAVNLFPKHCVYMRWQYGDPTTAGHRRVLQWYKDSGLKVMSATAAAVGSSTFMPREQSRCNYIKAFNELTADNKLEGSLATSWDDGSPHLESVWRGFIGQGEYAWNPKGRKVEDFLLAHSQREFGVLADENCTRFLDDLEKAFAFFDGALVTAGRRNPAWGVGKFTLLPLPQKGKTGEWCKKYAKKLEQAEREQERFERICKEFDRVRPMLKRNRFTFDIYAQLNELQHYPVKMILALAQYDRAASAVEQQKAKQHLTQVCNDFQTMRNSLEKVYSQSRFLIQPAGVIDESNAHNHIAALTKNFDWMYLYEKPMVEQVEKWLKKNK